MNTLSISHSIESGSQALKMPPILANVRQNIANLGYICPRLPMTLGTKRLTHIALLVSRFWDFAGC